MLIWGHVHGPLLRKYGTEVVESQMCNRLNQNVKMNAQDRPPNTFTQNRSTFC